jgi:hypothetical protein
MALFWAIFEQFWAIFEQFWAIFSAKTSGHTEDWTCFSSRPSRCTRLRCSLQFSPDHLARVAINLISRIPHLLME